MGRHPPQKKNLQDSSAHISTRTAPPPSKHSIPPVHFYISFQPASLSQPTVLGPSHPVASSAEHAQIAQSCTFDSSSNLRQESPINEPDAATQTASSEQRPDN